MAPDMDNSVGSSFQLGGNQLSARLEDLEQLVNRVVLLHGPNNTGLFQTPTELEEFLL